MNTIQKDFQPIKLSKTGLIFIQEKDLTFANFVTKLLQAVEISKCMSELHMITTAIPFEEKNKNLTRFFLSL